MKIFLSALENQRGVPELLIKKGVKMKWNLMSYYYIRKNEQIAERIRDNSELVLIDSGGHTLQKSAKVDFLSFTKEYAEFIKTYDRPNVLGYFEMDVDNIIGYENVLALRKILDAVSDKIIPVWHRNRGIEDFKRMCEEYSGRIVAITGFKNEDIKDDQYIMFLKYARKFNTRVHCLGMTRTKILDKVPFDYTDSSSWMQQVRFGKIQGRKGRIPRNYLQKYSHEEVFYEGYLGGMAMQKKYYEKWRSV